jgi:hypothetical protein
METEWRDPDGDQVFVEVPGVPPMYASQLSAFLGSLVAMYWPDAADGFCQAVRDRDVIVDEFTVTLRDACGATTEVPATVTINVVDKVPPNMVYPARDRTVECDGQGNTAALFSWLRVQGGAWASDNCCDITWTNDYSPDKFVTTCGRSGSVTVTFTAHDCVGNASPTAATFRIVDTTKPRWAQPMPTDLTVACHQVPPPPVVSASDTCDPDVAVAFEEERVDGACPHTYTLIRTWRASDACGNSITHTQTITVRDTTPPELTAPPDVDLGCNPSDTGPEATGWATATDSCDPSPEVTYTDSVSTVGCRVTIERSWQARDACGNPSPAKVQRITYTQDTLPPVIHCPGNITLRECFPPETWVWVSFGITGTDNCGSASLVCDRYGDWFRVGTSTPVTVGCTATDGCGNTTSRTCTFTVTVNGNRPPVAWSASADAPTGVVCIPVPASDPDGDPLTIEVFDPSPCGATWVQGNMVCYGTFGCEAWQIPPGTVARFMFRVTDPCGASATEWVYITITCEICPMALPPGGDE